MANGIPQLLNQISNLTSEISLVTSDFTLLFSPLSFAWGIYLAGTNTPVIVPTSFVSFDYDKEYNISNYPVEQGSFSSYNKVTMPYYVNVRMCAAESAANRSDFLNTLDQIANSTDLYDVITPEKIYLNASITKYDYSRSASGGAGMIIADIKLIEIRTTASTTFNHTSQASDAPSTNTGQLNTKPADPNTTANIVNKISLAPSI